MLKLHIYVSCFVSVTFVLSQTTVNNVRLVNHANYLIGVVQQTINDVEAKEWCNLKIGNINQAINRSVYGWQVAGDVTYANGFVVSIRSMDISEQPIPTQIWSWENDTASVEIYGTLRLYDLAVGFDVIFHDSLNNEERRYTGKFTHPQIQYKFSVSKNLHTEAFEVAVTTAAITTSSSNKMIFLPRDNYTQVLSLEYDRASTEDGIKKWATEIFQPAALEVVINKVEFPSICYNCAA